VAAQALTWRKMKLVDELLSNLLRSGRLRMKLAFQLQMQGRSTQQGCCFFLMPTIGTQVFYSAAPAVNPACHDRLLHAYQNHPQQDSAE
jgi:hypothetical protein